jgi:ACR3 family arsenite efflux pump ArsB
MQRNHGIAVIAFGFVIEKFNLFVLTIASSASAEVAHRLQLERLVSFAPIVALLLGLSSITVPWNTLLLSVVLYIVVPVIVAQFWRHMLLAKGGQAALAQTLRGATYRRVVA